VKRGGKEKKGCEKIKNTKRNTKKNQKRFNRIGGILWDKNKTVLWVFFVVWTKVDQASHQDKNPSFVVKKSKGNGPGRV